MKKALYLIGAGGLGREVGAWLRELEEFEVKGYYDDGKAVGEVVYKWPVIGSIDDLAQAGPGTHALITVGDPMIKERIARRLSANKNLVFPAVVHPRAEVLDRPSVRLGAGTIISAGCVLTVAITLGEHVLINLNCTIGHDANVGSNTSIMPGVNLAGDVSIGRNVLIGSGAQIINRVTIGDGARVGAGAVVISRVEPSTTVVGVPAKPLPQKKMTPT